MLTTSFASSEDIINYIKENNTEMRITPQRRAIIQTLFSLPGHFSADEMISKLQDSDGNMILTGLSKATVYSTLDMLVKVGILGHISNKSTKSEYQKGYSPRSFFERRLEPHINLICNKCGKIEDMDDPELTKWFNQLSKKTEYHIEEQSIGLYGECHSCS